MFRSRDTVEVEVYDRVDVHSDCSCTIVRTYRFRNAGDSAVRISWLGHDSFPPECQIEIADRPGAAILGKTDEQDAVYVDWHLSDITVDINRDTKVSLRSTGGSPFHLSPLSGQLRFASRYPCRYNLTVFPPFPQIFNIVRTETNRDNGEGSVVVVGRDGELRTSRSILVSGNRTGPFDWKLVATAPMITKTQLLEYYGRKFANTCPLDQYVAILIPHLLNDSVGYIETLRGLGLDPGRTHIIGIPYSTKDSAVATLWHLGYKNIVAPKEYPFAEAVRETLSTALAQCERGGHPLLVVEDGGYVGPMLHEDFIDSLSVCHGIVEQTRNGIWQYRERGIKISLPVINVAESELKLRKESPLIGSAVVFNIETLLRPVGRSIKRYRTIVVGFGSTGRETANALQSKGMDVCVFDKDSTKREEARESGFKSGDDLSVLLKDRDLIIGCTGEESIPRSAIARFEHHAIFANASSKRRELDYAELKALTKEQSSVMGIGTEITLINGNKITLLADGFPVNFVGESVEDEEISFIYGLLLLSALYVVQNHDDLPSGLVPVPATLQDEINEAHESLLN